MPITRMEVTLLCSKCLKEDVHTLIYDDDILVRSECRCCGKEVLFYEGSLLTIYAKEVVRRILTKPARMSEELRADLRHVICTLPSRIASKPRRIIKEVKQVVDEDGQQKKML